MSIFIYGMVIQHNNGGKVMRYTYYDYDPVSKEEFDIIGEDYIELMKLCVKYSKTVCFRKFIHLEYNSHIPERLEKYRLQINENTIKPYYGNYRHSCFKTLTDEAKEQLYLLELSEEVIEWLLSITNDVWDWDRGADKLLPEDPVFFREDDSVFADSIIHNGEFSIYPRDGEDVSSVVTKDHWHCFNDR